MRSWTIVIGEDPGETPAGVPPSFAGADGERLPAIVMLPRHSRPPYQVLVYFPGSDATRASSSRNAYMQWVQFLVRSGRAVVLPIYQQTYERRRPSTGANFLREISIQRGRDVRRTVDYLESRADIDRTRIAFYGVSLGAQLAPVYLAIEPRLRTVCCCRAVSKPGQSRPSRTPSTSRRTSANQY